MRRRTYTHTLGSREFPVDETHFAESDFEDRLISAVRDHVPHVMRAHGTPGLNVAIGYRGRLIWEAGFGYADVMHRKPMTPRTVFRSGSLGKTYTAIAVMQLAEQGILELGDPINRYLPFSVHNPLGEREITIRDLMTHRSGLSGDSAESQFHTPKPLAATLEEQYATQPRARKYGPRWNSQVDERWAYSNLGLATLGLIVERANPQRLAFSEFVQQSILNPLGMRASQYPAVQDHAHVRPDIWERLSTGYSRMGGVWLPALPVYFGNYPAGALLADPSDHLRLLLALLASGSYDGYALLKPETVNSMLAPVDERLITEIARQGLVWRVAHVDKPNMKFFHSGGHMYGWTTQGVAWPRFEVALVVASNQWSLPDKSPDVFMVEDFLECWILRQPLDTQTTEPSREWSFKVSYVRGALFAFSYRAHCGVPEPVPEGALTHAVDTAHLQPGAPNDWDPKAFRRGVHDFDRAGLSYESAGSFWRSSAVVSAEELRTIYRQLGGHLSDTSYSAAFLPDGTGESCDA